MCVCTYVYMYVHTVSFKNFPYFEELHTCVQCYMILYTHYFISLATHLHSQLCVCFLVGSVVCENMLNLDSSVHVYTNIQAGAWEIY